MSDEFVLLNADDKEFALKNLQNLLFTAKDLRKRIETDDLSKEMSGMQTSLIQSYFLDVAKTLQFESHLAKESQRDAEITRNLFKRIQELEGIVASTRPIDGLQEQLDQLYGRVRDWWNIHGFYFVNEFQYYASGVANMKFCFMLDYCYSLSRTPATDRLTKQQYIEHKKSIGYELIDISGSGLQVLDSPINRSLLRTLLVSRFPSIRIQSFANRSMGSNDEVMVLSHIEATIMDLHDIAN